MKRLKNLWNKILDYCIGEKCEHCGSRHTNRNYNYTRGYNEWCRQAIGDRGIFCYECYKITWDRSYEEYVKILPEWCRGYPDA